MNMNLGQHIEMFVDHVFILSLVRNAERRSSLIAHFEEVGIENYSFFDATDANEQVVQKWRQDGKVHTFPPCFRCGQRSCEKDDCNNIIIDAQVANCISYRRLFEQVATGDHRSVLLVEDDIRFHPWAVKRLSELVNKIKRQEDVFDNDRACMLRLAWALNAEHADKSVEFSRTVRMSNPCFAITKKAAEVALPYMEEVLTTSDINIHQNIAPQLDQAHTVFPPLATELSWSSGDVDSEIHPKQIRAQKLLEHGKIKEKDKHSEKLLRHVRHIYAAPLLLVGHPRCGTKYVADLCKAANLEVGHELLECHGISSWMFAVDANPVPFYSNVGASSRQRLYWDYMVQIVRNPFKAIPSIMVDNEHSSESFEYRRHHILAHTGVDLLEFQYPVERAAWSLVLWNRIIARQKPDLTFRIEDANVFLDFLRRKGLLSDDGALVPESVPPSNVAKPYKGKVHSKPKLLRSDYDALSPECRQALAEHCVEYGYAFRDESWRAHQLEKFAKLSLEELGWFRSAECELPLDRKGEPLPWFTYPAIEFLSRIVRSSDRVFEFGSGWSTLWWSKRAAEVCSVEHDPVWYAKIKERLPDNARVRHLPIDADASDVASGRLSRYLQDSPRLHFDYPDWRKIARGLEDARFAAYASAIWDEDDSFDIVVIDGAARRLCASVVTERVENNGIVILNNTNSVDYGEAFAALRDAGSSQIDFWGPVPGAPFFSNTSVFLKSLDRLPRAGFQQSVLGVKGF